MNKVHEQTQYWRGHKLFCSKNNVSEKMEKKCIYSSCSVNKKKHISAVTNIFKASNGERLCYMAYCQFGMLSVNLMYTILSANNTVCAYTCVFILEAIIRNIYICVHICIYSSADVCLSSLVEKTTIRLNCYPPINKKILYLQTE